ncbi:signal peptidase I [Candidatus Palibaumannia cicadellinicola]|uniref:Signal peptidase I n=1 Tax=Baumannia cicadellinicola subsp. Homalodisca coagulata TaxID=374463 RepID=Q1LTI2_BAUCH|nr:signal peptidase I [Candidatus Baumannia cicadellinicola]ABF13968.1 signal peptidase I [Baumannia cicadellinicola str. Hc (Homalodisca coagulata)]MBS0032723.1 signal peptidase I [Candidatus Baumannia cicadellinicola]MCJ7462285.1 signal peptidase I [Candidatus Baumannia cicadellinicola]MCJ7462805.1 signal peptidase I [Candidatus Baumannia cicadellinicola]
MAHMFALLLAVATLITGILWLIKKFKLLLIPCENTNLFRYNNNLVNLGASVFPVLLLVFIVRSFIIEPYQIPSSSMMPTLLVGDFILVNKFAYGIKNPITQNTIINIGHPKRGDIVVFQYPYNTKQTYVKRVIGLPGDLVSYDPIVKHITIKPGWVNHNTSKKSEIAVTYSDITLSDFVQNLNTDNHCYTNNNFTQQIKIDRLFCRNVRLLQCQESLDGVVHNILFLPKLDQDQSNINNQLAAYMLREWIVPQDQYFMMGDNRDNSSDSRYWGFVPEKNLVGKAIIIWISFDKQEGQWPTGIRFSHIGGIR